MPSYRSLVSTIGALVLVPGLAAAQGTVLPPPAPKPTVAAKKPADKPAGAPAAPAAAAPAAAAPAEAPAEAPAAAPAAAAPKADATKILVLPYQAIYRSVPQKKLSAATELLFKELGQKDDVAIVKGAVTTAGTDPANKGPNLDAAHAAVEEAEKAEKERRIDQAIAAWQKAQLSFEANAAAISNAEEYLLVHHRLARAFMMAGRDKEAMDTLTIAARMAPGYALAPTDYPRLYRRWFTEAGETARKERPGQIAVSSALPGAKVTLDGRPMDTAPLLLDKVTPGKHLVWVQIPDVTPFGAVLTVPSGGKAETRAIFSNTLGGNSVGKVTDAIAENGIPTAAVDSAAAAGKEAGAKFVIFGGMAQDEDKFRVHTFVVDASSAKITKLEEIAFDLELLTAEADVLKIANAVHGAIDAFPAGDRQVAQIEKRIRAQNTITKVDASPAAAPVNNEKKGDPKGPRKAFAPLKGGTVEIKDEKGQ